MGDEESNGFDARIEDMKKDPVLYEIKLWRELEDAVRNGRPVQPMLIGLDRLRKLAGVTNEDGSEEPAP